MSSEWSENEETDLIAIRDKQEDDDDDEPTFRVKKLIISNLRLKCPRCDTYETSQRSLCKHLRMHPNPRRCPLCQHDAKTEQNLVKHVRRHTGERPYACPEAKCVWAFKQKGDLLQHIRRGKHGSESKNHRKPPLEKLIAGASLPVLVEASAEDIAHLIQNGLLPKTAQIVEETIAAPTLQPPVDGCCKVQSIEPLPFAPNLPPMLPPIAFNGFTPNPPSVKMEPIKLDFGAMPSQLSTCNGLLLPPTAGSVPIPSQFPALSEYGSAAKSQSVPRRLVAAMDKEKEAIGCVSKKKKKSAPATRSAMEIAKGSTRKISVDDSVFSCSAPNCGNCFTVASRLQEHLAARHPSGLYQCPFEGCQRSFKKKATARKHVRNKHGGCEEDLERGLPFTQLSRVAVLRGTGEPPAAERIVDVCMKFPSPILAPKAKDASQQMGAVTVAKGRRIRGDEVHHTIVAPALAQSRKGKKKRRRKEVAIDSAEESEKESKRKRRKRRKSKAPIAVYYPLYDPLLMGAQPPSAPLNPGALQVSASDYQSQNQEFIQALDKVKSADTSKLAQMYIEHLQKTVNEERQNNFDFLSQLTSAVPGAEAFVRKHIDGGALLKETLSASSSQPPAVLPPLPPMAFALSCHWCNRTRTQIGEELSLCGGCKQVRYCSVDCQRSDFMSHKAVCQLHEQRAAQLPHPSFLPQF